MSVGSKLHNPRLPFYFAFNNYGTIKNSKLPIFTLLGLNTTLVKFFEADKFLTL